MSKSPKKLSPAPNIVGKGGKKFPKTFKTVTQWVEGSSQKGGGKF